jgi:hypothetical protein
MIAVVSSTIFPSSMPGHDGARTNIDVGARLGQTVASIQSLVALGFTEIHVADNSPTPLEAEVIKRLSPARVWSFGHYPYRNKGVAEALLLLAILPQLPAGQPVMKLSGRYRASMNLCHELDGASLVGLFSHYQAGRVKSLSTRAYAVRDRAFFETFLHGTLNELYASAWRVVGPRSLLELVRRHLRPRKDDYPYSDPLGSLEISAARWLNRERVTVRHLERIGVAGTLGCWTNPEINE